MGSVQHQWLADLLAAESVTHQANPKLPVLRHMPFTLAPVAEAPGALPSRPAQHRNGGRLVAMRNFRPGGIAQKPAEIGFPKATHRRIDHVVAAKLGQEYRDLKVGWFDQIVRVQAADVAATGKADAEIAIIAGQMRFRAVGEPGCRQPSPLEIAKNFGRRSVRGSPLADDDLKVRECLR